MEIFDKPTVFGFGVIAGFMLSAIIIFFVGC